MSIADQLLSLLFPHHCPFCGALSGQEVCESCRSKLRLISEKQLLHLSWNEDHLLHDVRAVFHYGGLGREGILNLKFRNHPAAARTLGKLMAAKLMRQSDVKTIDLIVPVPLHKRRLQQRGYNQALYLAKELSRVTRVAVESHSLKRTRETLPQSSLSDQLQREENLKNAFFCAPLAVRHVLLVDDVVTTGSTARQCAQALYHAGVQAVSLCCAAIGRF